MESIKVYKRTLFGLKCIGSFPYGDKIYMSTDGVLTIRDRCDRTMMAYAKGEWSLVGVEGL